MLILILVIIQVHAFDGVDFRMQWKRRKLVRCVSVEIDKEIKTNELFCMNKCQIQLHKGHVPKNTSRVKESSPICSTAASETSLTPQ